MNAKQPHSNVSLVTRAPLRFVAAAALLGALGLAPGSRAATTPMTAAAAPAPTPRTPTSTASPT